MFGASVGALNASFASWVEAQLAARPDVPVVEAALDYLSYARAAESRCDARAPSGFAVGEDM